MHCSVSTWYIRVHSFMSTTYLWSHTAWGEPLQEPSYRSLNKSTQWSAWLWDNKMRFHALCIHTTLSDHCAFFHEHKHTCSSHPQYTLLQEQRHRRGKHFMSCPQNRPRERYSGDDHSQQTSWKSTHNFFCYRDYRQTDTHTGKNITSFNFAGRGNEYKVSLEWNWACIVLHAYK